MNAQIIDEVKIKDNMIFEILETIREKHANGKNIIIMMNGRGGAEKMDVVEFDDVASIRGSIYITARAGRIINSLGKTKGWGLVRNGAKLLSLFAGLRLLERKLRVTKLFDEKRLKTDETYNQVAEIMMRFFLDYRKSDYKKKLKLNDLYINKNNDFYGELAAGVKEESRKRFIEEYRVWSLPKAESQKIEKSIKNKEKTKKANKI